MSTFKNMLCVMAAILWLPMVTHCQFETVADLKALACQSDCSDQQSSDCSAAGCCSVENEPYKIEQDRVEAPVQALILLSLVTPADAFSEAAVEVQISPPPELPKAWQFTFRAAPEPRAPSVVS